MKEIVSKRTAHTKCYDLGKCPETGRRKRRLSIRRGNPVHYRRSDGSWQEIDRSARDDRGDWLIDQAPYRLRISRKFPGYQYRSEAGRVTARLVEAGGKPIAGGDPATEDGLYSWGIDEHSWCEIRPLAHGVSTVIVLDNEQAPTTFVWQIQGDEALLQPPVGRDAKGQWLELEVTQDGDRQTVTWTGRVSDGRRLRRQGAAGWHTDVAWPVRVDPTVNEAIAATGDDRWDNGFGLATDGTGLFVGQLLYFSIPLELTAGFRFQTVDVPQGATIDDAEFSIEVLATTGTPDLRMYGNDVDDAATWSDPGNLPSAITQTTAFTEVDDFTSTGVKTVDVTSIVQEIVDRGSWTANNDLALVLFDNQASNDNYATLADLNHATAQEGQLDIDYTEAGGEVARVVGKGLTQSILLSPKSLVA